MTSGAVILSDHQSPTRRGCFSELVDNEHEQYLQHARAAKTDKDVERALSRSKRTLNDFAALISPAAEPYLFEIVRQSEQLTRQRFGLGINLFAPLYLSNTCANECSYCGFSMSNKISRITLNTAQIAQEVSALKARGFDQILLVTGETRRVGVDYLESAIRQVRPHFSQVNMEVQPLESQDYKRLQSAGLDGVLVYQETYDKPLYLEHHLRGNKRDFNYRLDTPDRLGEAQIHRIGLGVLLGLGDWREDSVVMAAHLRHLQKRYWRSRFSIGFPRIRPAAGDFIPRQHISDRQLIQLVAAWRLFDADLELSLSTRESERFRDHALGIGFTQLSAESKTRPGGYSDQAKPDALEQFEVSDERSLAHIDACIRTAGLEPIYKDWDTAIR